METQIYPVSATYSPVGWETPGIAWEDYSRCSTQTRKQSGERRLPTPRWALNDAMLRDLLVRFMEERAGLTRCYAYRPAGTIEERLQHAIAVIIRMRPTMSATAKRMSDAYLRTQQRY